MEALRKEITELEEYRLILRSEGDEAMKNTTKARRLIKTVNVPIKEKSISEALFSLTFDSLEAANCAHADINAALYKNDWKAEVHLGRCQLVGDYTLTYGWM